MIPRRIVPRLVVFYIFGMVLAALFDYQITAYLCRGQAWADVLEIAGEPPALLFTAFNFALCGAWCAGHRAPVRFALCAAGGFIAAFYACARTASYLTGDIRIALTLPLGGVVCFALFVLTFRAPEEYRERWVRTAAACIGAALTVLVVVTLAKQAWGRVRYRQMIADPSLAFTPWYRPNGFGSPTHVSFPSGHTANATVIFLVSLYFPKQRKWLQPALAALIAVMAVSRLCAGAHFLSDVLTGGALTLVICEVWVHQMWVDFSQNSIYKDNML